MCCRLILTLLAAGVVGPACWATEIQIDYTFSAPNLSTVEWGGVSYTRVAIAGATNAGNAGAPNLPGGSAAVLIPRGYVVNDVQVTGDETLVGDGYVVEPAALPFPISKGPTAENIPHRDLDIYGSSVPFPAQRYVSLGTQSFRGYDILLLRLQPTKYIPTTGALYYYPRLHVTVQTGPPDPPRVMNSLLRGLTEDRDAGGARG